MACYSKRVDNRYQVLLIGNSSVGKTSILLRHCQNEFPTSLKTTVGLDFLQTVIPMKDGRRIEIVFVDTAGTERFSSMMPSFYQKADAFVIVYDITDRGSFQSLTQWLDAIDMETNPSTRGTKVMVIGNKADLEDKRAVKYDEGMKFAVEKQMGFFETSAKTGAMVQNAVSYLASELASELPKRVIVPQPTITLHEDPNESKTRRKKCRCSSSSKSVQPNDTASAPVKNQDYKGKPSLEYFQYSPVNLGELQDLAHNISSKWKPIARHLSVPENTIEIIEQQYKSEGTDECLMKAFNWWQTNQARPYTWAILIEILEKQGVGRCNVAKHLRRTLQQRPPDTTA